MTVCALISKNIWERITTEILVSYSLLNTALTWNIIDCWVSFPGHRIQALWVGWLTRPTDPQPNPIWWDRHANESLTNSSFVIASFTINLGYLSTMIKSINYLVSLVITVIISLNLLRHKTHHFLCCDCMHSWNIQQILQKITCIYVSTAAGMIRRLKKLDLM